jgi:hypothetical protein
MFAGKKKKRKDRQLPDLESSDYGRLPRAIVHPEDRNHLEKFNVSDKEKLSLTVKALRKKGAVLSGIYQNPEWRHQGSVEQQGYLSTDSPVLIDVSHNGFPLLETHDDSDDTRQIFWEHSGE